MSALSKKYLLSLAAIIASASYLVLSHGGPAQTGAAANEEAMAESPLISGGAPPLRGVEKSAALIRFARDGKMGFTATKGELAIPAIFDYALDFSANGLAAVKIDGRWGFINAEGELVIPAKFEQVGLFDDNGLAAAKVGSIIGGDNWGFINAKGDLVIADKYEWVSGFKANGLAEVKTDNVLTSHFINAQGERVDPDGFGGMRDMPSSQPMDLIPANYGGRWGYADAQGAMVIPARFEALGSFAANGLAGARIEGKWGFINTRGELVIPAEFDIARDFQDNGLAGVKIGDKWGFIDAQGLMAIPARFDDVDFFTANGLANVKIGDKWGAIDIHGELVIPAQIDGLGRFAANGLAKAALKNKGQGKPTDSKSKWGFVDDKGEWVDLPPRNESM